MSIISVEIMKIINERERCDTRCVPTFDEFFFEISC